MTDDCDLIEIDYFKYIDLLAPLFSDVLSVTILQFLQKPYALLSWNNYVTKCVSHMEIDWQIAMKETGFDDSDDFGFAKHYIDNVLRAWRRCDPQLTGCILYEDLMEIGRILQQEHNIASWEFDQNEKEEASEEFPNKYITFFEFVLYAEREEEYMPGSEDVIRLTGEGRVNSPPVVNRISYSKLIKICKKHATIEIEDMELQGPILEHIIDLWRIEDKEERCYLPVNLVIENILEPVRDQHPYFKDKMNEFIFYLKTKRSCLVFLPETRYTDQISLRDLSLNIFRKTFFQGVPRDEHPRSRRISRSNSPRISTGKYLEEMLSIDSKN